MKNQWKYFLCFCVLALPVHAQFIVKGKIRTIEGEAITNANVVCKTLGSSIHAYAFTNADGDYELQINAKGDFILEFSSLGFERHSRPLSLSNVSDRELVLEIVLNKSVVALDEVILIEDKPIDIRKDTIVFDVDAFTRGNEEVVEDILKRLPNVNVDIDGIIRVGNREIEKVMIEGDDFFKRGYKMITKNMPSQPLDKVEIIDNYSENKFLKDISNSDKIALNLKLKEEAKRIWFGNAELAHGLTTSGSYELAAILMNIGKENKYYFYSNLNDIGQDAKGYISGLINPVDYNGEIEIGDGQTANSLLQLDLIPLNFKKERTNINNSEFVSLNSIFNPGERWKISTNGFLSWDENQFFRNSSSAVTLPGTNFNNNEKRDLFKNSSQRFMQLDLVLQLSRKASLKSSSRFSKHENQGKSKLSFNTNTAAEYLDTSKSSLNQIISYSKKMDENNVLLFSGRYIHEDIPQHYAISELFYPELFPQITSADNIAQNSRNAMYFTAFEAQLISKQRKGHLLELQIGDQYRMDILRSSLIIKESVNSIDFPIGYQNNLKYITNDLYFKTKYSWKSEQLRLYGSLGFHQLSNSIENTSGKLGETPFYVDSRIGFDWSPNKRNSFKGAYSFSNSNAGILDVYENFTLTGFQFFSKGTGTFNQLEASNFFFSYKLGNWSDKFFVNSVVLYNRNHDFFSSSTIIDPNYSLSERLLIKDRDLFNFNTKIDYYVSAISSNLKLDLGLSRLNYLNIVNTSELREVISVSYYYGVQMRSGFRGNFNFHAGTKWTKNRISAMMTSTFTDNISFLDLSFNGGDRLNFEIKSERYFFGNLDKRSNTYYFLDFGLRYILQPNKLELGITASNLFNTRTYSSYAISDIGSSVTQFRLLPPYILIKLKFRFGL